MKKCIYLLLIIFISCSKDDVMPTVKNVDGKYLFEGFINDYELKTDSFTFSPSSNMIHFGGTGSNVTIHIDSLRLGTYANFEGFGACIKLKTHQGYTLSWCGGHGMSATDYATIEVTNLTDSTFSADVDYQITNIHYPIDSLGFSRTKDTTVLITGHIEAFKFN